MSGVCGALDYCRACGVWCSDTVDCACDDDYGPPRCPAVLPPRPTTPPVVTARIVQTEYDRAIRALLSTGPEGRGDTVPAPSEVRP